MASITDILTTVQQGVVAVNNLVVAFNTLVVRLAVGAAAWTSYTPTVTAFAGTLTTVSATGRYKRVGKTVFFSIVITITTNGTGATAVIATLPVTASANAINTAFVGREDAVTGKLLIGWAATTTQVFIQNYDGTYPGFDGAILGVSGSYESA